MPTIFTKGDLFGTAGIDAFAIGVSAAGTMDAGTAVAFRKKWPSFFEAYKAACERGLYPGDVFEWRGGGGLVYALVLSRDEATSPKLPAFITALMRTLALAREANVNTLAMPRVGTKTARTRIGQGLDWTRVKKVLSEVGDAEAMTIAVVEQFIRGKDALEGLPADAHDGPEEADEAGAPADSGEEEPSPRRAAKPRGKKGVAKKTRATEKPKSAPKKSAAKKPKPEAKKAKSAARAGKPAARRSATKEPKPEAKKAPRAGKPARPAAKKKTGATKPASRRT